MKLRGRNGCLHFVGDFDGQRLLYCYIRKNACSAFKSLFLHGYDPALMQMAGNKQIGYLSRFCSARYPQDVKGADHVVFIHRDPFERALSTFINKFVQGTGNEDITVDYRRVTGLEAETASFDDFLHKYLSHEIEGLDVHVMPQRRHLWPILYTDAIAISQLHESMARIIGEDLAGTYFGKPKNVSEGYSEEWAPGVYSDRTPSNELRSLLANTGRIPPKSAFLTDRQRKRIAEIYREDLIFAIT
ncbi:MAG: sulfotransferase family 2 domain-containing protein [Pseudomonadota bacterium]